MTSTAPDVTAPGGPGPVSSTVPSGRPSAPHGALASLAGLARWDVLLLLILIGLLVAGNHLSPVFLTPRNLSNLASSVMEVGVMALAMTPIIVMGDIDLSVESMVGLSGAVAGWLVLHGVALPFGIVAALAVGALGGLMNGLLVTRAGLPSLVVTLGTLALFRGVAAVLLGPVAVTAFPSWFTDWGFGYVPGTLVPWTLIVFALLASAFWIVVHATWIGRQVFAIGRNRETSRYSGVRVATVRTSLFVITGVISALAGLMLAAYFSSARADNGTGLTLTVVTIVVLGGVDINGGRGSVPGVILAVFTLAALQSILRLLGVSSDYQNVAIGLLLVVSVVTPTIARQARALIGRAARGQPPPRDSLPGEVGYSPS